MHLEVIILLLAYAMAWEAGHFRCCIMVIRLLSVGSQQSGHLEACDIESIVT